MVGPVHLRCLFSITERAQQLGPLTRFSLHFWILVGWTHWVKASTCHLWPTFAAIKTEFSCSLFKSCFSSPLLLYPPNPFSWYSLVSVRLPTVMVGTGNFPEKKSHIENPGLGVPPNLWPSLGEYWRVISHLPIPFPYLGKDVPHQP